MICLTCTEPFTNTLINSKPKQFKFYDLMWDKISTTGFLNAKRQPLRRHEQILCFYKKQTAKLQSLLFLQKGRRK